MKRLSETVLVFGNATGERLLAAEELLLSLPKLCQGALRECDLIYRAASKVLVAIVRVDAGPGDAALAARLGFWAARAGGRAHPLDSLGERARAAGTSHLSAGDLKVAAVPTPLLGKAVGQIAAWAGAPDGRQPRSGGLPVLELIGSGKGWDGVTYDPAARMLFVPSPLAPPPGDEVCLRVRPPGSSGFGESLARVGEARRPGAIQPGSPAGFALQLLSPPEAVLRALEQANAVAARQSRSAPRYPVWAPVKVTAAGDPPGMRSGAGAALPVARLDYGSERELAADYVDNLSQGGAFVRSASPSAPGSRVNLEMRLPGCTVLRTQGTVVHATATGMGVKFELTAAEEAQLGEAIARIAVRQRRALVVDDDALARRIMADALAERGFDLFAAEDGTSALSILTDELLTLDLVVTDLRMPGMDGEALLNTIRKAGGETDLAVVMVTAGLAPRIEERLRGAGADAVLDKALGPEAIARAGEAAVERRRLERAGQRADSHPLS